MTEKEIEIRKLHKKICSKAGVTIRENSLISPGDKILVGLSGGKDSMIMLEVLADRKSALPFDFEITAAYIQVEGIGYKASDQKMQEHCTNLNIPFIRREIRLSEEENKKKGICFLCSWNRRKALFDMTREMGFNKLAFGHHRADALETLLLNMIYHGSISSLPYSLKMFEGRIHLIRPLLDMDENLLAEYARLRNFGSEGIKCSHESASKRDQVRDLISRIEKLHGSGPLNMFRSMDKVFGEYLPKKSPDLLESGH